MRETADEYLERVHVEVACPMPVKPAGWKETSIRSFGEYTRVLRLESEAVDAFRTLMAGGGERIARHSGRSHDRQHGTVA